MNSLRAPTFALATQNAIFQSKTLERDPKLLRSSITPLRSQTTDTINKPSRSEYRPGVFDDLLLSYFRRKMVQEVGWDSEKPGYDGLMEVVNRLMAKGKTNLETQQAAVFIERCKYLEESKCVGICIHTCKLPTQTFFNDHMGVPLLMEPNFSDFSCQFNFGVRPPLMTEDKALQEPCLEICPNATHRRERSRNVETLQCPKRGIRLSHNASLIPSSGERLCFM